MVLDFFVESVFDTISGILTEVVSSSLTEKKDISLEREELNRKIETYIHENESFKNNMRSYLAQELEANSQKNRDQYQEFKSDLQEALDLKMEGLTKCLVAMIRGQIQDISSQFKYLDFQGEHLVVHAVHKGKTFMGFKRKEADISHDIDVCLEDLQTIIDLRRSEVKAYASSKVNTSKVDPLENLNNDDSSELTTSIWEPIEDNKVSEWELELNQMKERIFQRRKQ